ncbi:type III pantothenate kinase [Oceanidesulfovibrio marinus]|uniref:Type III pantothenate kinase n=1 Tax=Oceanidesulfovibrio marinus TaxID=370038 RepID=A0ABX6NI80_9BACT|nr:type III pantothenate kinase [Oceanidesulfovibrio marinus]QJT09951.1 type III pantothenate kinase [Oceanidesulfovibrio marinus]
MTSHVILFDIGNTGMKIGMAPAEPGAAITASYTLPTDPAATVDSLGLALEASLRHAGVGSVAACVASSVVPSMDPILDAACAKYLDCSVHFVPDGLPFPMENRYERPREVGADRLLAAYAAVELHPAPAHIVIDFGTATTFDCVVGRAYLGGLICPGVISSSRALAGQTAKLPQIRLQVLEEAEPRPAIGRSTSQSLTHGILFGFASMVDGVVERLSAILKDAPWNIAEPPAVVATGGVAHAVCRVARTPVILDPDLLLSGLKSLYDQAPDFR